VEKIDASSSAAKNIQIELGSIKSGQKSHCAKFSWRKVIEWRKLPSRTCALGANNIAITRARVGGPSRNRACSYLRGSKSLARRHCELVSLFRGFNGWPGGSPVDASSRTSLCATHDSGPVRFAIPFLSETFTLYPLSISRRTSIPTKKDPGGPSFEPSTALPTKGQTNAPAVISHSVRSMFIRSSILRTMEGRLELRLCSVLSSAKKVRTNSATESAFNLKSAQSLVLEERHERRDHLVGSLLHQPMTGTLHHGAGHICRHQLHLVDKERAGRFLTRQDQKWHVQLCC